MTLCLVIFLSRFRYPSLDDQTIFWNTIRLPTYRSLVQPLSSCQLNHSQFSLTPGQVSLCPLDSCMFSAGALKPDNFDYLIGNLTAQKLPMVSIHANFLLGNTRKEKALRYHNLWLSYVDNGVVVCTPFAGAK